jgi:hypothetical protein
MSPQQDFSGFVHASSQARRAPVVGMQFLHERSVRRGNFLARSSLPKPQDLIGLILGHRARPISAAPRVAITIACRTPSGKSAVEVSV